MSKYLEMVKEFNRKFDVETNDIPLTSNNDQFQLRIDLLQEELDELKESYESKKRWMNGGNDDWMTETLDALCDLQYVLSGAVDTLGFDSIFDQSMLEVHKSNMTKIMYAKTDKDFNREKKHLDKKYGKDSYVISKTEIENEYIIRRLSDGKILKPSGYSTVVFSGLF